jgi:hypothetical protein
MNKFNVETSIFLNFCTFIKEILYFRMNVVYNSDQSFMPLFYLVFITIEWIYLFFTQSNGFHLPLILIEIL